MGGLPPHPQALFASSSDDTTTITTPRREDQASSHHEPAVQYTPHDARRYCGSPFRDFIVVVLVVPVLFTLLPSS